VGTWARGASNSAAGHCKSLRVIHRPVGALARRIERCGTAANRPRALPSSGAVASRPCDRHRLHLADHRSTSLDASAPQRMISGASAIGALWRHCAFGQFTQNQLTCWRICCSVGVGVVLIRPARLAARGPLSKPRRMVVDRSPGNLHFGHERARA
jgi:hypothetical protein